MLLRPSVFQRSMRFVKGGDEITLYIHQSCVHHGQLWRREHKKTSQRNNKENTR